MPSKSNTKSIENLIVFWVAILQGQVTPNHLQPSGPGCRGGVGEGSRYQFTSYYLTTTLDLHALRPEASADYGKRLTLVKSGAFVWRLPAVPSCSGGVWGGTDSDQAIRLPFSGFYGGSAGGVGGVCRGRRWNIGLSFFVRFFFRFLEGFWSHFGGVSELKIDEKIHHGTHRFFKWFFHQFLVGF